MSELRSNIGRNIREARERMGLRQLDLARVIEAKSSEIVSQIEKGSREVKAWELSRIASALHVELQDLLSPQRLVSGAAPLWRKEAGPSRLETEARLLQRSQRYRRVMELTGSTPRQELPTQDRFDVVGASYSAVEAFSESTGQALSLGPTPATRLFDVLENTFGVMVFYQDLREDGSAVSVRGPFGPAMLLNSCEPPWRRNFSCAHELFHLLTWNAAPRERLEKDPKVFDTVERQAEAFAGGLLLPRASLLAEVAHSAANERLEVAQLIALARKFGVSTAALLWRMKHLKIIPAEIAERLLGDADFRCADRSTMSAQWWTPLELPSRFVELAFVAYGDGKLSRAKLAELLETDLAGLPQLLTNYGLNLECDRVSEAEIAYS